MIPDLIDTLLNARGIGRDERNRFLEPDYVRDMHDSFLLVDMDRAVGRLLSAIQKGERIAIYADFDCDGIPASVVLHDTLTKIGHSNFEVYIPHRHNEGYGFHTQAIDALASRGVSLIVTVDVGTVAFDGVAHARSLGIDVIVTDHHEPAETLPDAIVINPKRVGYPFPHLCGAAVAFKLAQAFLVRVRERGGALDVPVGWEKWLLDMVAIATVADMVPLVGENRALARFGFTVLRKSPRPGLSELCRKLRLNQSTITEDDIGFSIAPRINAASRMDKPELAFRLLATRDTAEAEALAGELERLNSQRKGTVASLVKEARRLAMERFPLPSSVAVLGNPDWKPALLGLAANSLMEDRGGVVCLWGRDGNGVLKGSCRSDGSINLVELFRAAQVDEVLEEAGGHAMAGGFSVSFEQVHHLPDIFSRAAGSLHKEIAQTPSHDAEVDPTHISHTLFEALSALRPFGIGNPKPVFRVPSLTVESVRIFGKEQTHTELFFRTGSKTIRGFDFFRTPDDFTEMPRVGNRVDALATIERDMFRNSIALRLVDIVRSVG